MIINHYKQKNVIESLKDISEAFNVAVTGDIHLHHNKVFTERVIHHLENIYTPEFLRELDVLVLNGDVLDRRLSLESGDLTLILDWFAKIMRDCIKYGVKLYVLEGTRSHDHRQCTLFDWVNSLSRINSDIEYIETLKIVEMPGGHTALFVPDEVNHDASVTAMQVNELLHQHGLEKVDFVFMHGMFRYQAPIETPVAHSEDFYESICNYRIVVNHIHTPSANGKIRAPGSPVRLRHGEEETKGHYVLSLKDEEVVDWFIETENNVIFKTIDVTGMDYGEVIDKLDSLEYERGSHIRLRMPRSSPVRVSLKEIKYDYSHFKITEDFTDSTISELGVGEELLSIDHVSLVLTDDVIINTIKERVSSKLDDKDLIPVLEELINEVA